MKCSICQGDIGTNDSKIKCPECDKEYHAECWDENKGCGTPGCKNLPRIETKNETHYSQNSYWGVESKNCPACGEKIDIDTLVCPFCEEEFHTTVPIGQDEYKYGKIPMPKLVDGSGKIAIIIFISGLLGCTSFFCLIFGGLWFMKNRHHLKANYGMQYFLALTGLIVSMIYMLFFMIGIIRQLVMC